MNSETLKRLSIGSILERAALPIFLVALIVVFSLLSETGDIFRSGANVKNILGNQSVTAILALAMIVPLVSGYFDLSVGAVAGVANVTTASVMGTHHAPIVVGILAGLLIGLLIGCIIGALVAWLKLDALVVTLGALILLEGLTSLYTHGTLITAGIPESFTDWGSKQVLGLPTPFVLLLVIGAVVWYVLMHTPFGRQLESLGSNPVASRLVGIPVERRVFASFALSGLLAGAAGVLLTSRTGNGDPNVGSGYLFAALAAVFLGSTTIRPGKYNVWGAIIAVFVVAVAVNGFTLMGAESWVSDVFNGASLIIAVTIVTLIRRHREAQAKARSQAISTNGAVSGEGDGQPLRGGPPSLTGKQT